MGGYGGPDDDAQAAQDLRDNSIYEIRQRLPNPTKEYLDCIDCGAEIPRARREAIPGCPRCVECQVIIDRLPRKRIRLVDIMT